MYVFGNSVVRESKVRELYVVEKYSLKRRHNEHDGV